VLLAMYDRALPQVFGYLRPRVGSETTAEDLTAETFLAAVQAIERRAVPDLTVAWLIGVARHKLVDHWRRQERERRALSVVADDPSATAGGTVPVGTEFDVRMQTSLNSGTAKIEERFEATTVLDYASGRTIIVPAGSTVRGFVSSVRASGKLDRRAALTLSFDEIRIGNRSYRFRASVTRAFDGKLGDDTARIGAGAAVGAIIGGILAGGKGALLGVLVGGGGTMAASDGTDVSLPAGTILRVRLDQTLEIVDAK